MYSKNKPALSVIIPTYNEERYLPAVLKCLLEQSFNDFEIIVADNFSEDKTSLIAKKAGARLCTGGLPAIGRNNGAKLARADLLLFLDADVRIKPDFLEKSMDEFRRRKLIAATARSKPHSTHLYDRLLFCALNAFIFLTQKVLPVACGYCIFVTRKAFREAGGFDNEQVLQEDARLVQRVSKTGSFGLLRTVVMTSTRRFRSQGRIRVTSKIIWAFLRGSRHKVKYEFKSYSKRIAGEEKIIEQKLMRKQSRT